MQQAHLIVDKDYAVAQVDRRIFGSFVEHLGRAVYTGIYEPSHKSADKNGFRKDVLDLVKELNVSMVRYPGGNFVSGYNWRDGIGPKKDRPKRLDLAWFATETNQVGTNEFIDWCRLTNVDPMYAVNLGTGTIAEAAAMLEYCNHPTGTQLSDLRKQHGYKDPHNIKLWCLGNEMDGPWQIGHLDAEDYGKKAREAAKMMKWVDPSIELVLCGSATTDLPTYPEWDRVCLELAYEHVDYLSIHHYFGNRNDDTPSFLNSHLVMSDFIKTMIGTADYVKAKQRGKKDIMLSFDEWNVWFHSNDIPHERWSEAPRDLEDIYNLEDALVVGGLLCSLLNHSHRVKVACLAQLVNVIAPIMTDPQGPAWKQTIFYPFMQVATYGQGTVLNGILKSPKMDTKAFDEVNSLASLVIYHPEKSELAVFILNSDSVDTELCLDVRSFGAKSSIIEHVVLNGPDLKASNTLDKPNNVVPKAVSTKDPAHIGIAGQSWNMIRLQLI